MIQGEEAQSPTGCPPSSPHAENDETLASLSLTDSEVGPPLRASTNGIGGHTSNGGSGING